MPVDAGSVVLEGVMTDHDPLGIPFFDQPVAAQRAEIQLPGSMTTNATQAINLGVVVRAGAKAGVLTWTGLVYYALLAARLNPAIRAALEEGLARLPQAPR